MSRARETLAILAVVVGWSSLWQVAAQEARSVTPQPRLDRVWLEIFQSQRQELQNAAARGPVDVCFVGDSLTQYWLGEGASAWLLEFAGLNVVNVVNFGISADRTEHILWRIQRGDFAKDPAKRYVLLAGTNNLGNPALGDTPEVVFAAIQRLVAEIKAGVPESEILVLALPPNGVDPQSPLNQQTFALNQRLLAADLGEGVTAVPLPEAIADSTGGWKRGMTTDGTHFSSVAYGILAEFLKARLTAE